MASLTYCLNRPEKLVYKITEMGEEDPQTYDDWYVRHTVPISDARPRLASLSLDREGFVLRRLETSVANFYDEEAVRGIYDAEVERLILKETGAEKVVVFDHTIRTNPNRCGGSGGYAKPCSWCTTTIRCLLAPSGCVSCSIPARRPFA